MSASPEDVKLEDKTEEEKKKEEEEKKKDEEDLNDEEKDEENIDVEGEVNLAHIKEYFVEQQIDPIFNKSLLSKQTWEAEEGKEVDLISDFLQKKANYKLYINANDDGPEIFKSDREGKFDF